MSDIQRGNSTQAALAKITDTFKILRIIDINFSKEVLRKIISDFFAFDVNEKRKIQIRLTKAELRYHPHLYLIQLLLFCEKNSIPPKSIRLFYLDSLCTFNDHLIRLRFPDFVASMYYISSPDGVVEIPEIAERKEVFTILIADSPKITAGKSIINCDIEVSLVARDD